MKKIIHLLTLVVFSFALLVSKAHATTLVTMSFNNTTGDNMQVIVNGQPSSSILLSFLAPGASSVTSVVFGTTNSAGNFTTTISSGGYGIPQGSPVYAAINGIQSSTALWPNYTSTLSLSQTSVNLAVGQHIAVTGSNALILAANSMSSIIGAVLSGSQVTITGLSAGSGTLSLCSTNLGCNSILVTVGGQGQSQISFSQNNFTLNAGVSKNIDIYGGSNAGFLIISNSNASVIDASISGTSNFISLYGKSSAGTATIVICSKDSATNCANLNITTLSNTVNTLSFTQNNITLNPGITQNIIVAGGPDNNYYISSNSNSGVAQATIAGNTITLIGGSNPGSTVIAVCSATLNATCSNLNITLTLNSSS
ncbi:MAG: hypothetical protein NT091_02880, partial [Candidatus Falkowbacteria bacterium]|nr:hypothetical protein [Candidatus Falkowbacteria bacterium]